MTENDEQDRIRKLLDSEAETQNDITPHHVTGERPRVYREPLSRPALDADNMPLPRRVDQVDLEGTRVTPAAVNVPTGGTTRKPITQRPVTSPPSAAPPTSFNWRGLIGCFVYGLIGLFFVGVIV